VGKRASMNRRPLTLFLIGFLTLLLAVGSVRFGLAQATGTSVSGVIYTITTWTKVNSPYTLTGNVLVYDGAVLTIQPGVTVNLGSYYIEVNGTLQAVGTSTSKIVFNSNAAASSITFTPFSDGWNGSTSTGSIIENAIINSPITLGSSVEIIDNTINGGINVQTTYADYPTADPVISNNYIEGGVGVGTAENALISNNSIVGTGITLDMSCGSISPGAANILRNTISGCPTGVTIGGGGSGSPASPIQLLQGNLITNNTVGVEIDIFIESSTPVIENNSIANNGVGISVISSDPVVSAPQNPTIQGNNIYNNTNYNFKLQIPDSLNAQHNWWGTTDSTAIGQTIYDFKDDFNLGKVDYTPFLTAPNPDILTSNPLAPGPTETPQPSPNPTNAPTPTPSPIQAAVTNSSTLSVSTNSGEVYLVINGNITSSQISDVTIAANNSTTTALYFTVTGESGNLGYCNITIPKNLAPSEAAPIVFIDGQQAQIQGYTQDVNNYYVWFITHFSTHQVSIVFKASSDEPSTTNFSSPQPITPIAPNSQAGTQFNWLQITISVIAALAVATTIVLAIKLLTKDKD